MPKKSPIWVHFSEESEGKVTCLYCGQQLSVKNKSTCSLIRHMNQKHPAQSISRRTITEAPIKEANCSIEQQQPAEDSAIKLYQQPSTSGAGKLQAISSLLQKPLSIVTENEIDKQLICMIAKEYHPGIVEDKEFKHLLYLLNPNYNVPTRKTVSNLMIPAFYNEALELVKSRLDRAFVVCLTTNGWAFRKNDSFHTVTAHYIVEETNNTFLSSDLLGCISFTERHTAEDIANKLKEVIDDWKLTNKIVAVVSDNAENMKTAMSIGGWSHWDCLAHSLNLVSQSGLSEIKEVVDKIKNIVAYFKRSSYALSQLKAAAVRMEIPVLKLKNEVATRWNSTYDMMCRVLQMKNAIISTLALLSTSSSSQQRDDFELTTQLRNEEWIVAEQAINVLEVFNLITLAISSEQNINASTIIFYYKQISKHLNSFDLTAVMPQISNMVKTLQLQLRSRFHHIQRNNLIAQATILDPRFKKLGFIDEEEYQRAVENLYTEVANTKLVDENVENKTSDNIIKIKVEPIEQKIAPEKNLLDALWDDFDAKARQSLNPSDSTASAIVEVNTYLEESILLRKDTSGVLQDPFVWWHQRKYIYPKLYQIMKTRLCIMATSVPSERIFSRAGQIVSAKREILKSDKLSRLAFLSYNLNNCT
ncbi:E3 SUMO-protein ligase ZBED1 [Dendroctonus ponderosae]|uniref:E3 SUMO-protein ligase ZBED1 n=1 Tax=Dendroctonus ponderosae TaxID=77166 RepID=UPI00203595AF|nr:E3 SUMO-protein ligase ZBED1 [Dendroctonus ponderosae]